MLDLLFAVDVLMLKALIVMWVPVMLFGDLAKREHGEIVLFNGRVYIQLEK